MPTYKKGDMWSSLKDADYFLVTTNSFVKNNGDLVMGAGIAKQMRDKVPGIAARFGTAIKAAGPRYGVILLPKQGSLVAGAFQVKNFWGDPAELGLIRFSTEKLTVLANAEPNKRFDLNFPGIGNGKLDYVDVFPIVNTLPDNVHIWTLK